MAILLGIYPTFSDKPMYRWKLWMYHQILIRYGWRSSSNAFNKKSPPPPFLQSICHHPIIPSSHPLAQVENTGVQLIRQASAKTNDVAGDGTTSGPMKGAPFGGAQGHGWGPGDGRGSRKFDRYLMSHDGSMVLLYMVTWIPLIYPQC